MNKYLNNLLSLPREGNKLILSEVGSFNSIKLLGLDENLDYLKYVIISSFEEIAGIELSEDGRYKLNYVDEDELIIFKNKLYQSLKYLI